MILSVELTLTDGRKVWFHKADSETLVSIRDATGSPVSLDRFEEFLPSDDKVSDEVVRLVQSLLAL